MKPDDYLSLALPVLLRRIKADREIAGACVVLPNFSSLCVYGSLHNKSPTGRGRAIEVRQAWRL
jgi:hypothetical protein